ncbi:hypothetical protein OF83DRAFT_1093746 [Amylostereum chailletii]|nr:hypothetical protein OF83DRAFT_1093746 [Amylostereum chailletii]
MDLPSSRELELEALLRKRDAQLVELTDEVNHLRQYLSSQPGPSTTDPISLPAPLVSLLLPNINVSANDRVTGSSSSTVATALTQRVKLLQEENDELYELLKSTETGRLKEEVRGLRRAMGKMETALRESHQVIRSLSDELDKSYETVLPSVRSYAPTNAHGHPNSRQPHQVPPHLATSNGNGTSKPLPTGPRAHKKPRLSSANASPATLAIPLPRASQASARSTSRHMESPERSPLMSPDHRKTPAGRTESAPEDDRDRDLDTRSRPRSPSSRGRGDKEWERDQGREKERERTRDRDRTSRRSGHGRRNRAGRSGAGVGGGGGNGDSIGGDIDRTLAERMGL